MPGSPLNKRLQLTGPRCAASGRGRLRANPGAVSCLGAGETLRAIQDADVADIRTLVPEAPAPVAEFFEHALHPEARRRPASAEEFRERWEQATRAA